MYLRNTYIASFLLFIIGFLSLESIGQNQSFVYKKYNWANSEGDPEKSKIQISIESLKKAGAGITDSTIATKLESLGYLAIAQSGFSATTKDINQRTGYWMLSYPVAIKYGLTVNNIIDERKDLSKSTQAAYYYWKALLKQYKTEEKADLVFIESAIAVAKFEANSLMSAAEKNALTSRKVRLKKIKDIYQKTSINPVGLTESMVWVTASKPILFEVIHHFTQISSAELTKLNPQWVGNLYDPAFGKLKLPLKYREAFDKNLSKIEQKTKNKQVLLAGAQAKKLKQLKGDTPDLNRYKPIRYKVKSGDNLGRIAQRHHVKISSIRAWNELRSDRIYAGQKLTIYIPLNQKIEKVEVAKKTPKKVKKAHPRAIGLKAGEYQEYTVKTGDTLWAISQLFENITADMIMEDNDIDENISPGQALKIRKVE
ncbi:MAG: LysM peptidoglycan-binding domain-containing protein [Cyclobacteriaceae bacterium]|nr:LysM peptidoglycan-binding domain-containing protein [Cyclobacteriaceae bacterium]